MENVSFLTIKICVKKLRLLRRCISQELKKDLSDLNKT